MSTLNEISSLLGFAPQHIFALVANSDNEYINIQIPKSSNPAFFRDIDIPTTSLKGVQKQILKKILSPISINENVYSYVKSRSVVEAAQHLCGDKAVLKIDIKDFFPSISYRRVFGLFKSLGFDDDSCFILTKLTTYKDRIAQGAPTSPAISNIILRKLDASLILLSNKWEMGYLRYSDDLFFYHGKNFNHPELCAIVRSQIEYNGFIANEDKTKYYPRGTPRKTLGLLTHRARPAMPGATRRKIRHNFFKGSRNIGWGQENLAYLKGVLQWYKCVYGKNENYLEYSSILATIERIKIHVSYQSV